MLLLVLFEGKGFLSNVEGKQRHVGFYCNRRVETESVESVDPSAAIELILDELRQKGVTPTADAEIEMREMSHFEPRHEAFEHGFTFYPEGGFRRLIRRLLKRN